MLKTYYTNYDKVDKQFRKKLSKQEEKDEEEKNNVRKKKKKFKNTGKEKVSNSLATKLAYLHLLE